MGILNLQGNLKVDLENLSGPPVVAEQKRLKQEQSQKDQDDEQAGEEGTVAEYCPHGIGFAALHRNFVNWRSVPPGWKRRLLAEASDIALGNLYI